MIRFETLLEKVRAYSPEADLELLRRAYVFSALEHKGQVRHSGDPYLVHPLEVADFLADMKLDVVAVSAGLLHDVVEDTLTTPERIAELFGPEIAHVVEGVTKLGAIPFSSSEERQAENFRKMLLAMVDDIRVILVKLADRLHNMRTLHHLPEERRTKIAQETLDIYAPIANRLGMSKVKNELEELAFKSLEPKAYDALQRKVEAKRKNAESVIGDLTKTLRAKLEEAQVPIIELDGRIKRLYSIHLKLKRQKIDLERVYDFVALRVITPVGEGLLRGARHHPPDVVAGAGPHQGLHRDAAAERLPVAAHLGDQRAGLPVRGADPHRGDAPPRRGRASRRTGSTRKGRVGDHRDERYFQWLRQLLEVQQEVRDPQEFLQNLKIDLYPEEVYIFTPKGEVRSLPRGATAVDFAYGIHTDVGNQCVGARDQRQDGAAAHAAAERRHRRDHHAVRPQAEPRLADVRRHRRARATRSSTSCRARSGRAASSSAAGCSRRRRGDST